MENNQLNYTAIGKAIKNGNYISCPVKHHYKQEKELYADLYLYWDEEKTKMDGNSRRKIFRR